MLERAIADGDFQPGSKIPTEKEIGETFMVSRITSAKAVDYLYNKNLIYRKQGKGTFVAQPLISDFSGSASFTEDMLKRGLKPSSKLIQLKKITHIEDVVEKKLKIPKNKEYYKLVRIRYANNNPMVVEYCYLPVNLYPDLSIEMFEESYLYEIIRNHYGYNPTWAEAIIEAAMGSKDEERMLDLDSKIPVLVVYRVTSDEKYRPLEYVHSVHRSDRFSFSSGRSKLVGPNRQGV